MDKLVLENLTYKQLEDFTDEWIVKTKDFEDIFANQLQQINRSYFTLGQSNTNLENINTRLNVAHHLQHMIDLNLKVIEQQQMQLADLVFKLEQKTKLLYSNTVNKDVLRDKIYGYTVKLNEIFANMQNKFVDINLQIVRTDERDVKDPAELLARILMTQLYNLEAIEIKLHKLADFVQVLNCKKARLRNCGWNYK